MDASQLFSSMQQQVDAQRVFGEPVERDGVTLIPVAAVMSLVGGGLGDSRGRLRAGDLDEEPAGAEGAGGGYGLIARPVGAWVVKDGEVSWQPALDLKWVIAGGQLVAAVALVSFAVAFGRRRLRPVH
jgi:uncharacterized spore protein YtfJ